MKIVMTDELFITIAQELYYKYRKFANIKMDIKEEHKPLVKRVYIRFFKKYMEE